MFTPVSTHPGLCNLPATTEVVHRLALALAMALAISSAPEVQERRLVIAVDYGTTYTGILHALRLDVLNRLTFQTGVAIATPAGYRANLSEIEAIVDWGSQMGNDEKVPSVISYSPASAPEIQQWGGSLSPEAVAMVHTKLELDVHDTSRELDLILQALDGMYNLHFQYVRASRGLPEYTWKAPEKIVEDYLTKVFDALLVTVEDFTEELRALIAVDIVVTVPAVRRHRIAL